MIRKIATLLVFLFLIILFVNTSDIMNAVIYATYIFKNNIFPTLFPFLIISQLMIELDITKTINKYLRSIFKFLKISDTSSLVFVISLFTGSPTNAKNVRELYLKKIIKKEEAEELLSYTHYASPLFIMGFVALTLSRKVALLILIIHILTGFIIAYLFSSKHSYEYPLENKIDKKPISYILTDSIKKAIDTSLIVLGSITFIYIVISGIETYLPKNPYFLATIKGIFEMTQGIVEVSKIAINLRIKGTLSIMLLSFGGISIFIQILSILSDTNLSTKKYILARIIHASISGLLFYLIYPFI